MLKLILLLVCLLHAALAAPQFVTFKDGKVGVNFGGFRADAGLGGLLTGNAAHGGLSASAGTPWGPKAAAGLGGSLNGRTSGVAYAGAEANPSVGASAVLAGNAGESGFAGSEAHAGGKVTSKTVTSVHRHQQDTSVDSVTSGPSVDAEAPPATDAIQKIKPPKKYSLIKHNSWSYADKNRNSATATANSSNGDQSEGEGVNYNQAHSRNYNINGGANGGADVWPQHDGPAGSATAATTAHSGASAAASNNDAATLVVVNRQRQRQRQHPKHQQRRQHRERLRERKVEVQRAHWTKPEPRQRLPHAERIKIVNVTLAAAAAAAPQNAFALKQAESETAPLTTSAHSTQYSTNIDTYVGANPHPSQNTNNNYNTELNAVHSKHLVKHYNRAPPTHPLPPPSETTLHIDSGLIGGILNIPIGILRSLQQSIGGLQIDKTVSFSSG